MVENKKEQVKSQVHGKTMGLPYQHSTYSLGKIKGVLVQARNKEEGKTNDECQEQGQKLDKCGIVGQSWEGSPDGEKTLKDY